MLRIDSNLKVILFLGVTDFRLGINGLKLKVLSNYADKELTDILFAFCSKDFLGTLHFTRLRWIFKIIIAKLLVLKYEDHR